MEQVHAHGLYDIECDTATTSAQDCARQIRGVSAAATGPHRVRAAQGDAPRWPADRRLRRPTIGQPRSRRRTARPRRRRFSVRTSGGTAAQDPAGRGRTPSGTRGRHRRSGEAATSAEVLAGPRPWAADGGASFVPAPDAASTAWSERGGAASVRGAVAVGSRALRAGERHLPCVTSRADSTSAPRTQHRPAAHATSPAWAAPAVRAGPARPCVRPVRDRDRARGRRPEGTHSCWWPGGRPPLR
ncbi:hypothetical protein [Streptomyces sp. NPDC054786]